MIDSAEALKARNGSAERPAFSAAIPMTSEMTTICSTLKPSDTLSPRAEASIPRKFAGSSPVRKSTQLPDRPGASACSALIEVFSPGLVISPSPMPMATAMAAVMANQSSVWPASRAALVTLRRFAMEATIAVNTSGGTIALSRPTNEEPIVSKVTVRAFSVSASTLPMRSAT